MPSSATGTAQVAVRDHIALDDSADPERDAEAYARTLHPGGRCTLWGTAHGVVLLERRTA